MWKVWSLGPYQVGGDADLRCSGNVPRKTNHNPRELKTTMQTLRETYLDLIYKGSRKRQDLLSKSGAWGPWERVEGERRGRERSGEKYIAQ